MHHICLPYPVYKGIYIMNIEAKIGISILVWCFMAAFLKWSTEDKDRGSLALPFWSTVVAIAVFLTL